ncbi:MAG: diacylglycerol kinase family lipid kinase, partial [Dehalococcoidales bacterium]|nr:diacylglycerol kinase family lipid kinase [Dehalococcoidales bacterium]
MCIRDRRRSAQELFAKVIVNPVAGAGRTARRWPEIMGLFRGLGLRFEYDLTEAPGHAIELAKEAGANGYDMVVSVGGDGTVHEVVNGLYASGNLKRALLGIICTGTGSDYIRTIGIPRRPEEAMRRLLGMKKLTVDLGMVEYVANGSPKKRLFVNFAGIGFDAEIVRRTTLKYKSLGSLPSYLLGVLTTLVTYRNQEVAIRLDGEVHRKRVCTVIMNNGRYGGGGMFTAPDADLTDGWFDVLTVGDLSKPDLLCSLPRIYKGTHLTHPKVNMKRAKEAEVTAVGNRRIFVQADGELLGELPARFCILPSALNVLV